MLLFKNKYSKEIHYCSLPVIYNNLPQQDSEAAEQHAPDILTCRET